MNTTILIKKILIKQKNNILFVFIIMFLITIFNILMPMYQQNIIDEGLVKGNFSETLKYASIILLLQVLVYSSFMAQQIILCKIKLFCQCELQQYMINHALKLKNFYVKKNGLFKIINETIYDVQMISLLFGNSIFGMLFDLFKILGYFIGLIYINYKLAIAIVFMLPVKYLITKISSRKTEAKYEKQLDINKKSSKWKSETFNLFYEIKLWNLYEIKEKEFKNILNQEKSNTEKINFIDNISNLLRGMADSCSINMLYVMGCIFINSKNLSLGGLITFITFSTSFFQSADLLMNLKILISQIKPSLIDFNKFCEYDEEDNNWKIEKKPNFSVINFDNVSVCADGKSILKKINFSIKKGEKIAVIGENGSGKTTLVNILLRMNDITEGNIEIDGDSITDIELAEYRNLFAYMSQFVNLFNTTIYENISMYGLNNVKVDNTYYRLLEFVKKFPDKEAHIVGNNGDLLSGGEKQRIALLRTIIKKSEIIIFDEATSSCDIDIKTFFVETIENSNKTIICITHDLDIIKSFDKVIYLENGSIRKIGTYDDIYKFLETQGE